MKPQKLLKFSSKKIAAAKEERIIGTRSNKKIDFYVFYIFYETAVLLLFVVDVNGKAYKTHLNPLLRRFRVWEKFTAGPDRREGKWMNAFWAENTEKSSFELKGKCEKFSWFWGAGKLRKFIELQLPRLIIDKFN